MNRESQYFKSVNILLDAYNSGELEHQNCGRCAVGNLLGNGGWASLFSTGIRWDNQGPPYYSITYTSLVTGILSIRRFVDEDRVYAKGYSLNELAEIESAFEYEFVKQCVGLRKLEVNELAKNKQKQFEGLCRVLDKLKEIHEVGVETHDESIEKLTLIKNKFETVC